MAFWSKVDTVEGVRAVLRFAPSNDDLEPAAVLFALRFHNGVGDKRQSGRGNLHKACLPLQGCLEASPSRGWRRLLSGAPFSCISAEVYQDASFGR